MNKYAEDNFIELTMAIEGKTHFDTVYRKMYISKAAIPSTTHREFFIKETLYTAFLELIQRQEKEKNE